MKKKSGKSKKISTQLFLRIFNIVDRDTAACPPRHPWGSSPGGRFLSARSAAWRRLLPRPTQHMLVRGRVGSGLSQLGPLLLRRVRQHLCGNNAGAAAPTAATTPGSRSSYRQLRAASAAYSAAATCGTAQPLWSQPLRPWRHVHTTGITHRDYKAPTENLFIQEIEKDRDTTLEQAFSGEVC